MMRYALKATWCVDTYWKQSRVFFNVADHFFTWAWQEAMKFNKGQNLAVKQCQDKTRFLQKRQQENTARVARGEDPLPEEDINKLFKPLPPQNRWVVRNWFFLGVTTCPELHSI